MADTTFIYDKPSIIFDVARNYLEREIQSIYLNVCDLLWLETDQTSDVKALMYEVASDFVLRGANNASLITHFSTGDPLQTRAGRLSKIHRRECQHVGVEYGWHMITGDPGWDASDPLVMNDNNQVVLAWRVSEFVLAKLWNRWVGYDEGEDIVGFDFSTLIKDPSYFESGTNDVSVINEKPEVPDPLPQGIWSLGQTDSVLKSNFMLWLKGDGDGALRQLINKEDIPTDKPEWEDSYVYTTEVNNEGGQFQLLIQWREEGKLSDKYLVIRTDFLTDRRLRLFITDETKNVVYTRDWEVFPLEEEE